MEPHKGWLTLGRMHDSDVNFSRSRGVTAVAGNAHCSM
jgi:hypothetical protein